MAVGIIFKRKGGKKIGSDEGHLVVCMYVLTRKPLCVD